jgi:hypothetical protein
MFQHLDDPAPLPPSTREQRRATLRRGEMLRRRRRTGRFAALAGVAALIGALALRPGGGGDGGVPPVAASPSPSVVATATAGPGRGTITVGGTNPELSVTFTMPAGWQTDSGWLFRSDNYGRTSLERGMPFGFVFLDVANIYVDGCQWQLVEPPPGPSVDDLVAAYAEVPGAGTARDVTVDGYRGKLVEYIVPEYDADDCQEGRFGLLKEEGFPDDTPNIVAQAPEQQNQIRILDVGGTRLVILMGYPPNLSARDQAELDAIVSSVQIE